MHTPSQAPAAGPEFRLGRLLVSLMDAAPGHERDFHRWYERDHFYAGCMTGPGFFAGRRFVATRALRALRRPRPSAFLPDPDAGAFLALYFLADGDPAHAERWAVDQVNALVAAGRMHPQRRPVHAGFYDPCFEVAREPEGVPAALALDHPFGGVVLASFEDAGGAEPRLRDALDRCLPGTAVALALGFAPRPLLADAPAYVPRPAGLAGRRLVVCFVEGDPAPALEPLAAGLDALGAGARLDALAPFVPTVPGTDRFVEEIA